MEVDENQLRAIIEADHLTATQEVAQKLNINHSIQHLKQIGKVEKPNEMIKKKIIILKCHLLLFYAKTN